MLAACRVKLERVTTDADSGYLVFTPHHSTRQWLKGTESGLVVHVSGDTLYCLCMLLRDEAPNRPMPLDLVTNLLAHGASRAPSLWGLLKVAIVALSGNTFIGRVYFGAQPCTVATL